MVDDAPPALLQRRNLASLVLVNLGVGTHAIVWFMVVTAMPNVVDDLRAAPYLSWATSIYLVSTILGGASMALLKARLGARPALVLAGIVVTAGGLLAAAAPGIALVLVGRVLQGLGEGVLVALSYALVRELFDIRLLPRVFGIQAVTWAFAIFLGPLAGGWLTETWSWRAAFVGTALLPLPMLVLVRWVLPGAPVRSGDTVAVPALRLMLLASGVMAIAVSNRLEPVAWGVVLVLFGFALIALMLHLDRASTRHIFPTVFPGLKHPVSLGLWVLLLMPLSHMCISVYTPFLLQFHRGQSPTVAGYLGAVHAVAWSLAAVVVAPWAARAQALCIQAGPLLIGTGLAGLAWALPDQPLAWITVSLLVIGTGFGISYAFLNQRVMAAAQKGQEDATAGSAPTLGALGGAIGAAIAGLVGQAVGLDLPLDPQQVTLATGLLAGGGAVLAVVMAVLARRLLRATG
ncbi:MFS transporter [Comamonadaceae bacterium G21597-S1]|nr:MFS transporter [Comamonadaceae bacterium G21597-S1]